MLQFQTQLEFSIFCVSTLLTLVNPIGISTVFLALTERFDPAQRKSIASKGCVAACIALIVCALIGSYIFKFFAITLDAFRIMGGILFFRSGLKMIEANVSRTRSTPKEQEEGLLHDDIAVSPIGIPLIAGPGAITASMVLSGQSLGVVHYGILLLSIVFVMILTYFILSGANSLAKRLGATGTRIIQRIMGLILLVIATQFVINGVTPVLEGILRSSGVK